MHLATPAWTDSHRRVAVAYAVGLLGCLIGLTETGTGALWAAGAVAATAVVSLRFDAFGGIVAGLAAAAGLIAVKRMSGDWNDDAFTISLAETAVIVLAGAASGFAGVALRRPTAGDEPTHPRVLPVNGSLGLLEYDVALARLEEEVARARAHGRPLTVVMVHSDPAQAATDSDAHARALRAVARCFESRLGERDVPFCVSPQRLGAILPESSVTDSLGRIGAIIDALGGATFIDRATGQTALVCDTVDVHVGMAELAGETSCAQSLLEAASAGLDARARQPA